MCCSAPKARGVSTATWRGRRRDRGPGVVVLHDMFGLNEPIRGIAEATRTPRLRGAGAEPVLALGIPSSDFVRRCAARDRMGAAEGVRPRYRRARTSRPRRAGCAASRTSPARSRAVGFCGGGRWAYLAAARTDIDAAAALYGLGISQHLDELPKVKCPVQLHYGMQDQHVPRQEINAVSAGVERAGEHRGVLLSGRGPFVRQSGAADL